MLFFLHHYEIPALEPVMPVVRVQVIRPLDRPAHFEPSQLLGHRFFHFNSTMLGRSEGSMRMHIQQSSHDSHSSQSDSSSSSSESSVSRFLIRPTLHQPEDAHTCAPTHSGYSASVPTLPVQESVHSQGQFSNANDLRLTRLQKSSSNTV